jgi:hypothetical protein
MTTLYRRVLAERFESLHPALRLFLGEARGGRAAGRLRVTRGAGRIRNLLARALGIPPTGEYDVLLEILPQGDVQRWVRRFGPYMLETCQWERRGLLVEASGPGSIGFELTVREGALHFQPRRAWAVGIPLPLWMAPRIVAENTPSESGGWRVRVRFGVPLLGQVAEYVGVIVADASREAVPPAKA